MGETSLYHIVGLPVLLPIPSQSDHGKPLTLLPPIRKSNMMINSFHVKKRSSSRAHTLLRVSASSTRDHHGGHQHDRDYFEGKSSSVDEDMVVLRRRIDEIEAAERKEEVSSGWMQWEKDYYRACGGRYSSDVCVAVANLQAFLLATRPSVALGMIALLFVAMATSGLVFLSQLLEVAKWVISAAVR